MELLKRYSTKVIGMTLLSLGLLAPAWGVPSPPPNGEGCDIHVAPEGEEYASIQSAINAAEDGATICVQPGLYEEALDFNGANSNLILRGPNWDVPGTADRSAEAQIGAPQTERIRIRGAENIAILGFEILGPSRVEAIVATTPGFVFSNNITGRAVYLFDTDATVTHNWFNDTLDFYVESSNTTGMNAIYSQGNTPAKSFVITDNRFTDVRDGMVFDSGTYVDVTIERNEIRPRLKGINFGVTPFINGSVVIKDNEIYGGDEVAARQSGVQLGVHASSSGSILIEGNLIQDIPVSPNLSASNIGGWGIDLRNGDPAAIILPVRNNRFVNLGDLAIRNTGSSLLDARENFFDSASGPNDTQLLDRFDTASTRYNNVAGSGAGVFGPVRYWPWYVDSELETFTSLVPVTPKVAGAATILVPANASTIYAEPSGPPIFIEYNKKPVGVEQRNFDGEPTQVGDPTPLEVSRIVDDVVVIEGLKAIVVADFVEPVEEVDFVVTKSGVLTTSVAVSPGSGTIATGGEQTFNLVVGARNLRQFINVDDIRVNGQSIGTDGCTFATQDKAHNSSCDVIIDQPGSVVNFVFAFGF
jgi:hypothetical protein